MGKGLKLKPGIKINKDFPHPIATCSKTFIYLFLFVVVVDPVLSLFEGIKQYLYRETYIAKELAIISKSPSPHSLTGEQSQMMNSLVEDKGGFFYHSKRKASKGQTSAFLYLSNWASSLQKL